jgi:hypothetical protein
MVEVAKCVDGGFIVELGGGHLVDFVGGYDVCVCVCVCEFEGIAKPAL